MNLSILDVSNYLTNDKEFNTLTNNTTPYLLGVPEQVVNVENLPIVRINQIGEYDTGKASNKAFSNVFTVQIDFWSTKLQDIEKILPVINRIMEEHNYSQTVGDLSIDPDFQAEQNVYRLARRYKTTIIKSTFN